MPAFGPQMSRAASVSSASTVGSGPERLASASSYPSSPGRRMSTFPSTNTTMGRTVTTSVTWAAQAITSSVDRNERMLVRLVMVGGSISISPARLRAKASAGRTQMVAMVSPSSCRASWPGGATVMKNRVS